MNRPDDLDVERHQAHPVEGHERPRHTQRGVLESKINEPENQAKGKKKALFLSSFLSSFRHPFF